MVTVDIKCMCVLDARVRMFKGSCFDTVVTWVVNSTVCVRGLDVLGLACRAS
jgi:hypothetical protein